MIIKVLDFSAKQKKLFEVDEISEKLPHYLDWAIFRLYYFFARGSNRVQPFLGGALLIWKTTDSMSAPPTRFSPD